MMILSKGHDVFPLNYHDDGMTCLLPDWYKSNNEANPKDQIGGKALARP